MMDASVRYVLIRYGMEVFEGVVVQSRGMAGTYAVYGMEVFEGVVVQ